MKILYVTTISDTVNAFLIPHIKMLIDGGHQVDVAFNIEQKIKPEIFEMGCKVYELPLQRSPLNTNNFRAYKMIKKIIVEEKYDLVHTHTPIASAVVRLACRDLSNMRVFYTAHGFHFYKGAPLINWLVYYPVEKVLAKYTDVLITINKEDYERAKAKFKAKRVEYVPGVGIDVEKYSNLKIDRVLKRKELGVPDESFVLLSVGELNKNKNHEVVIRALAKIENSNIHYLICGEGPLKGYLQDLVRQQGLENRVHLLGFRRDIPEICKSAEVFVFPSFREGLGLAALEAMAAGLPIITSNVHGIVDYSIDGITGFTCSPTDILGFSKHIKYFLDKKNKIGEVANYNSSAVKRYKLTNVLGLINKVYHS